MKTYYYCFTLKHCTDCLPTFVTLSPHWLAALPWIVSPVPYLPSLLWFQAVASCVSRRWHTFDQTCHGFVLDSFCTVGLVLGDWTQTQTLFFGCIQRKSHFLRSSSTSKVRWVWTEGFNNFGLCLNVCWFVLVTWDKDACAVAACLFPCVCARACVTVCVRHICCCCVH